MSGGGTPSNTTQTQTTTPWAGQQPYLSQEMAAAQGIYNNPSGYPQYYPGQIVPNLNPLQTSGINAEYDYGASGGSPAVNAATGFETNLENGNYLNPTSNPNWQAMSNQVLSQTVPGLESQFTAGGAMNSPAAAYAVSNGANDALGSLAGQQYGNTLGLMNSGASWAAPGLQNANQSAIAMQQDAGNQLYTQQQALNNANVAQYNYNQTLPENMLGWYSGLTSGNYGGTSTLQTPYFTNKAGGALTGALGGAASGAMLGTAIYPGVGTAVGALAGGLLGGVSGY